MVTAWLVSFLSIGALFNFYDMIAVEVEHKTGSAAGYPITSSCPL